MMHEQQIETGDLEKTEMSTADKIAEGNVLGRLYTASVHSPNWTVDKTT